MAKRSSSGADIVFAEPRGFTASASFTPTATPYAANDQIDVAKQFSFTFASGAAIPAGSLIHIRTAILRIDVAALQASEAAYELQMYGVTPPSALADNAAWTLSSADLPSYLGALALGTPIDVGAALYVRSALDVVVRLTASSLFGALRTTPAFTPTAVARQVQLLGVIL
jgi:hypothetical protein